MDGSVLNEMKTDAICEIYNIAMGSASLAISGMIDSTVSITNPQVTVCKASEIVRTKLSQSVKGILFNKNENSVYAKINYAQGLDGTSVLVFSPADMQMIVNKLMGLPMEVNDDFEFDEMSVSAVSEVMNQMMGSAVTAMSQMLNNTVEITPPEAVVSSDTKTLYRMQDIAASESVCAIAFNFKIDDVIDSKFIIILSIEMANNIASRLLGEDTESSETDSAIITDEKKDAIGETQNIMMGSAATALSNFMNAKVWITTPKVGITKAGDMKFSDLEPSVCVKINYIKGIHGSSFLVLKQSDVQLMVNQLMGLPPVVTDDFVFDEMNISAVCEIMNQMMGASATTLSEIINTPTDISPPEAIVLESSSDILKINNINDTDDVCNISFDLTIDGIMSSHFVTMLSIDLANEMADKMLDSYSSELNDYSKYDNNAKKTAAEPVKQPEPKPAPKTKSKPAPKVESKPVPPKPRSNTSVNTNNPTIARKLQVEDYNVESFDDDNTFLTKKQYKNLRTLLDVPMDVTVRIGSTQKSIDEVGNFTKGTIIELDTLADEPVEIIVNGNLIARGDVVVVDDNFAVRITEIVE